MLRYPIGLFLLAICASAELPKLRLGDDVRPVRYHLDLTLIPEQDTFTGRIEIDLDIRKAADIVWLNARTLKFDDAKFIQTGSTVAAKVETDKEFAGFTPPSALQPGPAKLQIAFHGEFNKKGSDGLFKEQDGANWYVFTQFESIDARKAFPCFDEPGFKVPWQVTVHVKKEDSAVSNTPILSETAESDGRKKVVFAETKPLPS
jgi:cytosol alanyl aminopeptidase